MRRKDAGLSLVEVMISSAILVVVVAIAMGIMHSTSKTAANGNLMTQLEQRANRTLTFYQDQLATAAFTNASYSILGIVPNSNGTAFGYQLCGPATVLPTGATFTMVFGYPDPTDSGKTFNPKLVSFLRFEADQVYLESSASTVIPTQAANWTTPVVKAYPALGASETRTLNMDLNRNGTRTETFVTGRIMKYVVDASTNALVGTERIDDQVLLRVASTGAGDFSGDIDGDGTADPLVTFMDQSGVTITSNLNISNAARVQINLWHAVLDESGKFFITRNNKLIIHLRTERKNG